MFSARQIPGIRVPRETMASRSQTWAQQRENQTRFSMGDRLFGTSGIRGRTGSVEVPIEYLMRRPSRPHPPRTTRVDRYRNVTISHWNDVEQSGGRIIRPAKPVRYNYGGGVDILPQQIKQDTKFRNSYMNNPNTQDRHQYNRQPTQYQNSRLNNPAHIDSNRPRIKIEDPSGLFELQTENQHSVTLQLARSIRRNDYQEKSGE